MTSVGYALRGKSLTPGHKKLARLRLLYWIVVRRYPYEMCQHCGGRVLVVYHVPDAVWEAVTGHARYAGGECAGGVLCIPCVDGSYNDRPGRPFLRWTCAEDDSVMVG